MAKMRFTVNEAGLVDLLNGADAQRLVETIAKQGADDARRNAPVKSGDYRDSLDSTPAERTAHGAQSTFGSSDWAWHLIEFGSSNNPPYRPLTRAAMNVGLDFKDTGG